MKSQNSLGGLNTTPDGFPFISSVLGKGPEIETTTRGGKLMNSNQFDERTLEELLGSTSLCLALFTAPWCGVDRLIRSVFADISLNMAGSNGLVIVVDCNELPHIADRYRIDVFPTILLLERGTERGRKTGSISRLEVLDLLKELRN